MDKMFYGLLIFSLLAIGCAQQGTADNYKEQNNTMTVPFAMDYKALLAAHDVILESPPIAYNQKSGNNLIEGALMGNGDVGSIAHGTQDRLLFNIGKNDVWDRREMPLQRKPVKQTQYVNMVLSDTDGSNLEKLNAMSSELEKSYSQGHPTPKPCGQIILTNPALKDAPYYQRLSLYDAMLISKFTKPGFPK